MSVEAFRKYFQSPDVVAAVRPVLIAGRLIGIAPFKLNVQTGKTQISILALIWSLLLFGVFVSSVVAVTMTGENLSRIYHYSKFMQFGDSTRIYIGAFLIFVLYGTVFVNKDLYAETLKLLSSTDSLLRDLEINIDHARIGTRFFVFIVMYLFLHLSYVVINMTVISLGGVRPSYTLVIAVYLPGFISAYSTIIFNGIAFVIFRHLKSVNRLIRKLRQERTKFYISDYTWSQRGVLLMSKIKEIDDVGKAVKTVKKIWEIYDTVCDNCDVFNRAFSLKLLLILAVAFMAIVFNEFSAMTSMSYLRTGTMKHYLFLAFSLHQTFQYLGVASTMIILCNQISLEAKVTSKLINQMMIEETDDVIVYKLHLFSLYMLHRKPLFTGGGLFVIDNTLLFTIVGASWTYLIILIQFSAIKMPE